MERYRTSLISPSNIDLLPPRKGKLLLMLWGKIAPPLSDVKRTMVFSHCPASLIAFMVSSKTSLMKRMAFAADRRMSLLLAGGFDIEAKSIS